MPMAFLSSLSWIGYGCLLLMLLGMGTGCSPQAPADKVDPKIAEAWLATAELYLAQPNKVRAGDRRHQGDQGNQPPPKINFKDLLAALPPVEHWPEIELRLRQRMNTAATTKEQNQHGALLALFLVLKSHDPAVMQALQDLVKEVKVLAQQKSTESPDNSGRENSSDHLLISQWDTMGSQTIDRLKRLDPAKMFQAFETELESLESELVPKTASEEEAEIIKIMGGKEPYQQLQAFRADMIKYYKKVSDLNNQSGLARKKRAEMMEKISQEFQQRHAPFLEKYSHVFNNSMIMSFFRTDTSAPEKFYIQTLLVPDLVTIIGAEKAESYLRRALKTRSSLSIGRGEETMKLARKLALEMIEELCCAQWNLCQAVEARSLFEACLKKFPQTVIDSAEFRSLNDSRSYYAVALIIKGQSSQALAQIKLLRQNLGDTGKVSLPHNLGDSLRRAGYAEPLWKFLTELLQLYPEANVWSDYLEAAADAGKQKETLALAIQLAARPKLSPEARVAAERRLADAYLASDQLPAAFPLLSKISSDKSGTEKIRTERFETALLWGKVSYLSENAGQFEQANKAAHLQWSLLQSGAPHQVARDAKKFAAQLIAVNRPAEAEAVLRETLVKKVIKPEATAESNQRNKWQERYNKYQLAQTQSQLLEVLADVLVRQNKEAEVIKLLDESPLWGARDLAEVRVEDRLKDRIPPLGVSVAQALLKADRQPEALQVLKTTMIDSPGHDAAYALWIPLAGEEAGDFLNQLYAMDQYEERPLIWKAQWLYNQGKYEEAEKVTKAAIAVDPSDGEQGPDRRMQVYTLMGAIQGKLGRADQADFFGKVVQAIRLSERADAIYDAGMYLRAINLYQESLNFFRDAYCIQSRLALRLTKEGRFTEAEAHYQKAFELMPDSFGRVESHCFGCEGAFEGKQAQGIAERVFTQLIQTQATKPQVHYLMGYLREQQKRHAEALTFYQEAVRLDPEYLNAWKKILGLDDELELGGNQRDEINLKLISLDPRLKHTQASLEKALDIPRLWSALTAAQAKVKTLNRPTNLYALTRSAEIIDQQGVDSSGDSFDSYRMKAPEDLLLRVSAIQTIESILIRIDQDYNKSRSGT
jgi:tetratricopeptide (TPR) repeat protein